MDVPGTVQTFFSYFRGSCRTGKTPPLPLPFFGGSPWWGWGLGMRSYFRPLDSPLRTPRHCGHMSTHVDTHGPAWTEVDRSVLVNGPQASSTTQRAPLYVGRRALGDFIITTIFVTTVVQYPEGTTRSQRLCGCVWL